MQSELILSYSLLPHFGQCVCRLVGSASDVEITHDYNPLSSRPEISHSRIQQAQEIQAEIIAFFIPIRRAVYAQEHKGRKLKDNTTALDIESAWLCGR